MAGASQSFTKLVVDDLDRMADYYCRVFDLHRLGRLKIEKGALGEPIEEIFLGPDPTAKFGSFVLFKRLERTAPRDVEVIVGFATDDLDGMLARVASAGGALLAPVKDMPELAVRVAMVRDPEGHVSELVEARG